jgi:hypothetical protein
MVHAGKLFAVRACGRRTAKAVVRRTAKQAARQRKTHGSAATHGNVQNARQRPTHGNGEGRTAKKYGTAEKFDARQRIKRTAKGVAVRCGKNVRQRIRCRAVHCRVSAHGKGFAVRFPPFAVRFARTAKHCSPVV